ncbi:hypothetical protein [Metabacillus endolithicus]|uniref:Uncharacterized protein n=1 Tax=Metabacillus endolithicus TaxID=1535204 RepID=A0ABW5C329_9BACI
MQIGINKNLKRSILSCLLIFTSIFLGNLDELDIFSKSKGTNNNYNIIYITGTYPQDKITPKQDCVGLVDSSDYHPFIGPIKSSSICVADS